MLTVLTTQTFQCLKRFCNSTWFGIELKYRSIKTFNTELLLISLIRIIKFRSMVLWRKPTVEVLVTGLSGKKILMEEKSMEIKQLRFESNLFGMIWWGILFSRISNFSPCSIKSGLLMHCTEIVVNSDELNYVRHVKQPVHLFWDGKFTESSNSFSKQLHKVRRKSLRNFSIVFLLA